MSKAHKRKILWILLFSATLVFYVRTVPQVSLTERAIVIGLGIDYDEEAGYTMTAQIVNPIKQGQAGGASDSYGIISATAETLADAIELISQKTGLTVSLSQCNVVILGNSLLNTNTFPNMLYMVRTFQVPEQSILLATDKGAGDLLRAKPVLSTISSFYIQQTLTQMDESETVINTEIKDFLENYLSENGTSAIAYVTTKELQKDDSGGTGQGNSDDKFYEFDYGKSVLFSKGKEPMLLNYDDTISINQILFTLKKGGATVTVDDYTFSLTLKKNKYSAKAKLVDGRLKYDGKLSVKYFIAEVKNMDGYYSSEEIPDEVIDKIAEAVRVQLLNKINATYEKCAAEGYDVFGIYGAAYSAEGIKWKNIAENDYFGLVDFNIAADIKVSRK